MEIRQLRTFLCVAQLKSFTRAAAQLHVAQPALSRQIQKLEEELDVVLFERQARGVQLTESGLMLQRKAGALLRDLYEMRREIKGAGDLVKGHLTLAVPPVAGSIVLPRFLRRMAAEMPLVSVHLMEGVSSALQGWLIDKTVDFALLHNAPAIPGLTAHALAKEPMYVVGPADGVLVDATCRLHDLQGLPLILPSHPHFNRLLIEQAAVQYNLRLNVAYEVDGIGLTRELVSMGFGYGFMTYAGASQKVNSGTVRTARLVAPHLSSELSLVYLTHGQLTPVQDKAVALMRETVARILSETRWLGADLA